MLTSRQIWNGCVFSSNLWLIDQSIAVVSPAMALFSSTTAPPYSPPLLRLPDYTNKKTLSFSSPPNSLSFRFSTSNLSRRNPSLSLQSTSSLGNSFHFNSTLLLIIIVCDSVVVVVMAHNYSFAAVGGGGAGYIGDGECVEAFE